MSLRQIEVFRALMHAGSISGAVADLRSISGQPWSARARSLAGTGFESFSRLGSSPAALGADIVVQNRVPILSALRRDADAREDNRRAVSDGNTATLVNPFDAARQYLCTNSGPAGR